jgi:hypothetical protein
VSGGSAAGAELGHFRVDPLGEFDVEVGDVSASVGAQLMTRSSPLLP